MADISCQWCKRRFFTCPHCGDSATFTKKPEPEPRKPEWIILHQTFHRSMREEHNFEPVVVRVKHIQTLHAEQVNLWALLTMQNGITVYVRETVREIWGMIHGEIPIELPPLWLDKP